MFLSPGRAARIVGFAVLLSSFTPARPAAGAECAQDNYTEAGTCAPVMADPPMTPFQREQQQAKDAELAAMSSTSDMSSSRRPAAARPNSTNPGGGGAYPAAYQLKEVQDMTIFKEGEGNGKKAYTCGPSSTRNMVAAMYRRKSGDWKDFGEAKFAEWEGTLPSEGTARANVAKALNQHFNSFGHWTTSRPATPTDYLNAVRIDTYSFHQSVIANVNTEKLQFWKGRDRDHFDFVYGYYVVGSTHFLRIGEEYDPVYIFGSSSYNPYGHQQESLGNAFTAISSKSIHGIVS